MQATTTYLPTLPGVSVLNSALDVISKPENQAQASAAIRTTCGVAAICLSPGGAVGGGIAAAVSPTWTKFAIDLIDKPMNATWNSLSTKNKVAAAAGGIALVAAGGMLLSVPVAGSFVSCIAMGFAAKAGAEMTLRNLDRK